MSLWRAAQICVAVFMAVSWPAPAEAASPDKGAPPSGGKEIKPENGEQRIQQSAELARRIVEEMEWFDFWPISEDLWRVKQITLAAELKRTPEDLRAELKSVYEEAVTEAGQADTAKLAQSRWAQAGDMAFAVLRLPDAEHCYNESLVRADGAGDHQEALRLAERLADVMYAERRFQDESLQLASIAAQRTNPGSEDPAPWWTAVRTALCDWRLSHAPEALACLETALKGQPAHLTRQHPDLLAAWSVRFLIGEAEKAEPNEAEARRILAECERAYGKNAVQVACAALRLTYCLSAKGPKPEAMKAAQRARDLSLKLYGPDHPLTLRAETSMATQEIAVGHYDAAEALLRHSLEGHEKYLPPDHFDIMTDLGGLAMVAHNTNRLLEEQRLLRGAIEIAVKTLGRSAPMTVNFHRRLDAVTAKLAGRNESTLGLKETLPPQVIGRLAYSPEAVAQLNRAAVALMSSGQLEEGEVYLRRAVELSEKARAVETAEYGRVLQNLAFCQFKKKQVVEAERLLRRALAVQEKAIGPESPALVGVLDDLAEVLSQQDQRTEAERLLRRAVTLCVATGHEETVESIRTLGTLASVLQREQHYAEALEIQRRIQAATEISAGSKSRSYGQVLSSLAVTLNMLGRLDEADHALDQAIAIGEKLPQDDVSLANWLCLKAIVQIRRNETAPADALFRRGLGLLLRQSSRAGTELPELSSNFEAYAAFLKKAGLSQTQAAERVIRIRHGEDVPDL